MKYLLMRVDSEQMVCALDFKEVSESPHTIVQRGTKIEVAPKDGGERTTFLSSGAQSDGSYFISTMFGCLKYSLIRGELQDGAAGKGKGKKTIKSSMPGKILRIFCKEGDQVEKDQPLLIIEAMKMENEIRSPLKGTISQITVEIGSKVETGEILVKIHV